MKLPDYHPLIRRSYLEIHTGPMKSGKTATLKFRIDKVKRLTKVNYALFKPDIDTRTSNVVSRYDGKGLDCYTIKADNPQELFKHLQDEQFIAIDETQFFNDELIIVVEKLLREGKHIVLAGLDTDFRGEPFNPMPTLLTIADEVHKLTAICDFDNCNRLARFTQRLINNKPARYDEPILSVENSEKKESYETRCFDHHIVLDKPPVDIESNNT